MIKTLDVQGMNRRFNYPSLKFNDDMNVLTGLNGSGKTTLLKLLWYLTSGNLHRIISEILFTSINIETSWFNLSMEQTPEGVVKLEWKFTDKSQWETLDLDLKSPEGNLVKLNERIAEVVPGSLFFPTFRRIEEGYISEPADENLQRAIAEFSDARSIKRHKFIATMATGDISPLLMQKHEELNKLQKQQDTFEEKDTKDKLGTRFLLLQDIVKDIYTDYEVINISEVISFDGDGQWTISAEYLSSGEKQLLGFLCHNAFSDDAVMFLDEPELSLHTDYQRIILQLLVAQGSEKQFFVATHSPFIYANYSHKEINLERGGN